MNGWVFQRINGGEEAAVRAVAAEAEGEKT
jgi:hypothetical protein